MNWLSLLVGLAGGLLPGLFGGDRNQQPDVVTMPSLTPEQQQIMKQLADILGERLGKNLPAYPGQVTTPLNRLQTQAMASIADLIGAPVYSNLPAMPTYQPVGGPWVAALERTLSGQPAYTINPQATEEFYRSAVEAPAIRTFQEQILPAIKEEFVGPGTFWSSMRQQAQGKAAADLASALAGERARLAYEDEKARRAAAESAAQRAAGVLPAALSYGLESSWRPFQAGMAIREQASKEQATERQSWLDALQTAWGMGTGAQQVEAANNAAQYNEWLRQQAESSPYFQMALQLLGIPAIAAYQPPYRPSPWSQFLGLLGTIGAGWAQGGFRLPTWA